VETWGVNLLYLQVPCTAKKTCRIRLPVLFFGAVNPVDFSVLLKHGAGESEALNLFQFFLLFFRIFLLF